MNPKMLAIALAIGCWNSGNVLAVAQTPVDPTPNPTTSQIGTPPSPESADLAITSQVTAQELRFQEAPKSHIQFSGSPGRNTGWHTERQNLPKPVQAGVTYHDIGIQLQITSQFNNIDRLLNPEDNLLITPQPGEGK